MICAPRRALHGFTLVEMMVTLVLLALLAMAALPLAEATRRRADEAELRRALVTIRSALDAYKAAVDAGRVESSVGDSGYPPDLRVLIDGVQDKGAAQDKKLYFLRRLPRDPFCQCDGRSAEQTWETRSYDSSPEAFAFGEDVYDIRSFSRKEGSNGIPYNAW